MIAELRKLVGKRIRAARLQRKYTQRDLAILTGLSDKSISAYEKGKVLPPLDILLRIAKELGKPLSYFVDHTQQQEEVIKEELRLIEEKLEEIRELLEDCKKRFTQE